MVDSMPERIRRVFDAVREAFPDWIVIADTVDHDKDRWAIAIEREIDGRWKRNAIKVPKSVPFDRADIVRMFREWTNRVAA